MGKRQFIFFDVGNTLLFPNRDRILAPLPAEKRPTLDVWQGIERRTKHDFDQGWVKGKVDHGFWWTFHTYLLKDLGMFDESTLARLIENTQNSANWDQILPGTRDHLLRIKGQHSVAVISNSDGRINVVLDRCGVCDCFASVTDSGNVGHEKPHPAIFEAALKKMNADPADSLYVGDLYSVDYVGARKVGMDAVLFDVSGAYRDTEFPRVASLAELEAWLGK
jgi:HAD superfamily hydrolase (TIGR01509 family)